MSAWAAEESQIQRLMHRKGRNTNPNQRRSQHQGDSWKEKGKCSRCGKYPGHGRQACPANDAECRKCKKKGHYAALCRSKTMGKAMEEEERQPILGSVTAEAPAAPTYINSLQYLVSWHWGHNISPQQVSQIPNRHWSWHHCRASWILPKKLTIDQRVGQKTIRTRASSNWSGGKSRGSPQHREDFHKTGIVLSEQPAGAIAGKISHQRAAADQKNQSAASRTWERWGELQRWVSTAILRTGKTEEYILNTAKRKRPAIHYCSTTSPSSSNAKKVQEELKCLEQQDIIRPVSTPTDWCAPIVAVEKPNGNVRLCIDFTKLNDSIKRENFPLPTTDELLAQLEGATVFSKLDCNKWFHQIPLEEKSQESTTFITPFGRFCYKRLTTFGICSGPEVFHREMTHIVADIPGVICDIDDILISGKDKEEHDQRLRKVLERLTEAGATLNEKCVFSASSVKFLGHIISAEGIKVDPAKVEAIRNFPQPTNVAELRRLLGMVNHVGKFAPNMAVTLHNRFCFWLLSRSVSLYTVSCISKRM